ncbi:branched-chain amino acid aminotransferase II [Basidiobolus meristosporus CBS 931.73]|uniref:Branched-chain-amino-acid aminotransferase n=1 Tax=Basidiobolus meristosporus CBS 931.73 TaxID=1314790 RepID=A0A1Y1YUN1_9FUNG|nr:branched-chain amino acid aminotransferase II [Basidiobolus meristosporus CBS 931.73]|eukprot:ORY01711.1 branched-chain amino acid aminotransferase II [Basidiobolus meristosporus CBS 931.73]
MLLKSLCSQANILTKKTAVGLARPVSSFTAMQRRLNSTTTTDTDTFRASEIRKTPNDNLKELVPNQELVFGHTFTDNMLMVEWEAKSGWGKPVIKPYGKISLDPSASVLHYSFECFEGMKAYKDKQGRARLFRPDMNTARLRRSSERLTLPSFDTDELTECIKELVRTDLRWIPSERGYSMYIRPTLIGTSEFIGVGPSDRAMLFVICCPVGPYYKTGFKAVSLQATTDRVRAWPGGTGDSKIGGNYAPGILPQINAVKEGYHQNLWLYGENDQLTEVGTMNCFVFLKNEQGETELVTPPLNGLILPGVTRDSILGLAREWNEFKVSEREITMSEIVKAQEEGRLIEMFGTGTACVVSPIRNIGYQGKQIKVPLDPKDPNSQAGPLTRRLNDTLLSIQYGEIEHPWSVLV